jgi:hypothetical protein
LHALACDDMVCVVFLFFSHARWHTLAKVATR